jgi:hypothetical protein
MISNNGGISRAEHTSIQVNDSMSVPVNESNRHYQMILEWVKKDNIIKPYVAPVEPTRTPLQKLEAATGLTAEQIREALGV